MRGIGAIRCAFQFRSVPYLLTTCRLTPCPYLVSRLARGIHSGDEDGEKKSEKIGDGNERIDGTSTGTFDGASAEMALKSKTEVPYKGIQGLNVPYPKIGNEMNTYIFREMATCEEIEDAVYALWDRLTMREVEAAFYALKRLNGNPPPSLLDRLTQKTIELSDQVTIRTVSAIFLAAAKLKFYNVDLFNCLAKETMKEENLQSAPGVFCGTIAYALGALHRYFKRSRPEINDNDRIELYFPLQLDLIKALVHRVLSVRDEAGLTNKNIANFVYGLATMQYRSRFLPLLNVLAEEACRPERLSIYNEQEVSNIVYGFGILDYRHEQLLSHFSELLSVPKNLKEWTEQGISNVVYGFALLNYRPPKETMYAIIWETCQEHRMQQFSNQHLMNVIYGFTALGISSYRVLRCLLDELMARRHKFKYLLTGLSSVVYSFANTGIFTDGIHVFLLDLTSENNLPKLSDWAMTNLIRAFGKFPDQPKLLPYLTKLVREAVKGERLSRYGERQFAQILMGLGTCPLRRSIDPAFITRMIEGATVPGFLPKYTDQGLANVIYALVHLGHLDLELHGRLAEEATKRVPNCQGIALATFIYSWGRIPYRNEGFIDAVAEKLKAEGAVNKYSEQMLGNLLLGLIRLSVDDWELLKVLTDRLRQPDVWEKFLYMTTPDCATEILTVEQLDEAFKRPLAENIKTILASRAHELPKKLEKLQDD